MATHLETRTPAPGANAASPEGQAVEPTPDMDETGSLWGRYMPRGVSFFKMAMLDQLQHRSYHTVTQEGPFNLQQLSEDFRAQTFRSETNLDRSGKARIVRLLLRLDGGVFGYLENHTLNIHAPTPEAAQATAKTFRRYVKTKAAAKPCFHVISIEDHGPVSETVPVERSAPVTSA
jgi:hypothetical protein